MDLAARSFHVSLKPLLPQVVGLSLLLLLASGTSALTTGNLAPLALVAAIPITVALHEALHAVTALALGAKVSGLTLAKAGRLVVGVGIVLGSMPLRQWLLVTLAPLFSSPILLILSRLDTPLAPLLASTYLYNAVGSAGDLAFALLVAPSRAARVIDMGDQLRVEDGELRLWSLYLLDFLGFFGLALLFVAPLALLAAAWTQGRLELLGLLIAEISRLQNRDGVTIVARAGPGLPAAALLASAAFEALTGRRRVTGLRQAFLRHHG